MAPGLSSLFFRLHRGQENWRRTRGESRSDLDSLLSSVKEPWQGMMGFPRRTAGELCVTGCFFLT